MLLAGYQRAASQLNRHRTWLCAFQATKQLEYTFSTPQRSHLPSYDARSQDAGFATIHRPVKLRKITQRKEGPTDPASLYSIQQRNALRDAIAERRFEDVARLYQDFKDKSSFNRHDFRFIAQCLHSCFRDVARSFPGLSPQECINETSKYAAFADRLVDDLKKGTLAASSAASVHLLGFYKEAGLKDSGVQFWEWLETQQDYDTSADVYGAAIELLAVTGSSLSDLEQLYQRALVRFPGNFAAYHLSPDAIVADREQAVNLPGIPMTLLQGIMTARLLHGDFQNAYLALDTALRLYPDQTPTRFFTVYMEERPLMEAYTVFAAACRAGIVLPVNSVKRLQMRLQLESDQLSPVRLALSLRAQISILYLYSGGGGQLTNNMTNELIITLTRFVRLPNIISLDAEQKQPLVLRLMDIVRTTITIFARFGATPKIAAFNAIIGNLGGFGLAKQVVEIALADAQQLGVQPSATTRRSVLIAYGMNGDRELVSSAWSDLVQTRRKDGQGPNTDDWHCFIKAAHTAGCIDLARTAFATWEEHIPQAGSTSILSGLDDSQRYSIPSWDGDGSDTATVLKQLDSIQSDLQLFDEGTKRGPQLQNFSDLGLPMTMRPPHNPTVSEATIRELYDECTTEKRSESNVEQQSDGGDGSSTAAVDASGASSAEDRTDKAASDLPIPANEQIRPTRTQTGIPFGAIRYENWKTLNWLLEQANSSEKAYLELVDSAIADGSVPPQRPVGLYFEGAEDSDSYGLRDAVRSASQAGDHASDSEEAGAAWRQQVLTLRGK